MQLTEQQLFDYINCPTKYHIKYIMGIDIQEDISLPIILKKVSNYFYLNLMNGRVLSYNQIKKKWDTICEQYQLDNKKTLAGWGYLIKLMQWAEEQRICVADVETHYILPIDDIQLIGNIETTLVTPNKKIELLNTNFSEHALDQIQLDMKLKYSFEALAFKHLYNSNPDIQKIYSVKNNQIFYTTRTEPDLERAKETIKSVANGIKNNIFYPRESTFCKSCTAKTYCKYWHM